MSTVTSPPVESKKEVRQESSGLISKGVRARPLRLGESAEVGGGRRLGVERSRGRRRGRRLRGGHG